MAAMGSASYRTNKDGSQTRHYFLYCQTAKVAKTCDNQRGWTYDRVEGPLLDTILTLAMDDQHFAVADEATPIEAEVYTIRNEVEAIQARANRLADELEVDDDPDLRVRYRARKTELQAARERLANAEERLSLARGKASPAEHLRRVSEVRSLMRDADPDIRYQARARVKAALGDVIESMTFYPSNGNVRVMLVDRLRMFTISHAGEVIENLDFKTMFPDAGVGPGYGKVESRFEGKTSFPNDLTPEQQDASKGYVRRLSAK